MKNYYYKGHGLGNDYIVVDSNELDFKLTPNAIKLICDRNLGVGSDGILAYIDSKKADFGLQIFNPDGSEAEKSGNGLRIFARYLFATKKTKDLTFSVETPGGIVNIELIKNSSGIPDIARVEMGKASFSDNKNEYITIDGNAYNYIYVNVGNPHAVFFKKKGELWSRDELLNIGPKVENDKQFPKKTNVQLATPTGDSEVTILIWERGAGETKASGSSACAVASAAVKLGLITSPVKIKAPGGTLDIEVNKSFNITMKGPVEEVATGYFSPDFIEKLKKV
jgi:diaminopimelate epimerase